MSLPPTARVPGSASRASTPWWRKNFRVLAAGVGGVALLGGWMYVRSHSEAEKPEKPPTPSTALAATYVPPVAAPVIKAAFTEPPVARPPPQAAPAVAEAPPPTPTIVATQFYHSTQMPEYLKPKEPKPPAAVRDDGPPLSGIAYKAEEFEGTTAFSLKHPELVLPQWTSIPCVMETGIITGVSGANPFRCRTVADAKSVTGVVLMEAGTIVGGTYQSLVADGQTRIVAVTANARTPYNVVVPLGGPIADDIGQAGVEGTVDNHWMARIGGALLLTFLDAGVQLGQSVLSNTTGSTNINVGNSSGLGTGGPFSQVAQKLLDKTINMPPTIQLKQGATVQLWTMKWIDFSRVYRLESAR